MCWSVFQTTAPKAKIAKEDIKVYKILIVHQSNVEMYEAPYNLFFYEIGNVYTARMKMSSYPACGEMVKYEINEGLHSYSKNCKLGLELSWLKDYVCSIDIFPPNVDYFLDTWNIGVGEVAIFEAVIPAGSRYYINEDGEMVSNKLKITKLLSKVKDLTWTKELMSFEDYFENFLEGSN